MPAPRSLVQSTTDPPDTYSNFPLHFNFLLHFDKRRWYFVYLSKHKGKEKSDGPTN